MKAKENKPTSLNKENSKHRSRSSSRCEMRVDSSPNFQHKDFEGEAISELEILCTNCYDYIKADEVDVHSQVCVLPFNISEDPYQIDFRIRKLMHAIKDKKIRSFGDKVLLLLQIEDLANASLEMTMEHSEIISSLNSITETSFQVNEGISCYVYARRLQHLVQVKGNYRVTASPTNELDKWRNRVGFLLQLAGNSLSDINSEVSSDNGSVISFSTGFSERSKMKNILSEIGNEELEKYFYSVCIQRKAELPNGHPRYNLPISEVYEKAQAQGIEISDWKEFIHQVYS